VTEKGILNHWWATKMNLGFWRPIEIETYLLWCVIKGEVLNH
jgi:hypothetical protein